jgi:hypothetical protein
MLIGEADVTPIRFASACLAQAERIQECLSILWVGSCHPN